MRDNRFFKLEHAIRTRQIQEAAEELFHVLSHSMQKMKEIEKWRKDVARSLPDEATAWLFKP